jgi:hypothetical protein
LKCPDSPSRASSKHQENILHVHIPRLERKPIRSSRDGNATPATQPSECSLGSLHQYRRGAIAGNRKADALWSRGAPIIEAVDKLVLAGQPRSRCTLHSTVSQCVWAQRSLDVAPSLILFSASAAYPILLLIDSRNESLTIRSHETASATAGCPPAPLQE